MTAGVKPALTGRRDGRIGGRPMAASVNEFWLIGITRRQCVFVLTELQA
jgi:hypothetical protein